jgi:hypothetical protein
MTGDRRLSEVLAAWTESDGDKTLGGLVAAFEEKSFAILFVLLLAVPALPLPTGGATHVFELIAMLLALELIAGRDEVWLPARWQRIDLLAGERRARFVARVIGLIRRLERFSRPRGRWLVGGRLAGRVFGLAVLGGTIAAFLAPPFSGLDTLPALGVVLLALGFLLEDALVAVAGLAAGCAGVALEVVVGGAALHGLRSLF